MFLLLVVLFRVLRALLCCVLLFSSVLCVLSLCLLSPVLFCLVFLIIVMVVLRTLAILAFDCLVFARGVSMSDCGERWATAWRDAVVEAVTWRLDANLHQLAVQALKRTPGRLVLRELGIGLLLGDVGIWSRSPNSATAEVAGEALKKWKLAAASSKGRGESDGCAGRHPLGGLKAVSFAETLDVLTEWVMSVDSAPPLRSVARRVAVQVVQRGFLDWRHLEGVEPSEVHQWCSDPCQNALLERCVIRANTVMKRNRRERHIVKVETAERGLVVGPKVPTGVPREQIGSVSCSALATSLDEGLIASREAALQDDLIAKELNGLGAALNPAKAVTALKRSQEAGHNVTETLAEMVDLLFLETNRKSLGTIAASLRCWDAFALVKGYAESSTIPPRHDGDAMEYLSIFRNANTAANYLSALTWACKKLRLSLEWRTTSVNSMISGIKKRGIRLGSGALVISCLLNDGLVLRIQRLATSLGEGRSGDIIVVNYEWLCRVQSEGCKLWVGSDSDALQLPPGVTGSIWICWRKSVAYFRMLRRKNRPGGSLMARTCVCSAGLPCGFCAVARLTQGQTPGQLLWDIAPANMLKMVRRYLTLLHVPNASTATLKMFRSGKASSLAAQGKSMRVILELGQWRSNAVLNYIKPEVVDDLALLKVTLDASDAEENGVGE